jgi:hypothetical protein
LRTKYNQLPLFTNWEDDSDGESPKSAVEAKATKLETAWKEAMETWKREFVEIKEGTNGWAKY